MWAAITTAEGLGTWFGNSAEIDLRVGGTAKLTWDSGETAQLRIERLEPKTVFGYTWGINGLPEHDPRRTYVEFTLTPDDERHHGHRRRNWIRPTRSGRQHRKAFESNTGGWASELDELVAYLHV